MATRFPALQELGDSTRLSVFLAILGGRKNVSQIVAELGLAQPQVSYHLKKLKDVGLAVEEKDGRWVWYQANWDVADPHLRGFIELMARWAEDVGAIGRVDGGGRTEYEAGEPIAVGAVVPGGTAGEVAHAVAVGRSGATVTAGRVGESVVTGTAKRAVGTDARPEVERPKKDDSDLDDFLL
jgi:ArsR family transcriptional regulator